MGIIFVSYLRMQLEKNIKEVLMFVANESNRLQRKLVGLDK